MESNHLSDRIAELEQLIGEAYQIVGAMAHELGLTNIETERVLDNLSQARIVHNNVLPFDSTSPRIAELERENAQWKASSEASLALWNVRQDELFVANKRSAELENENAALRADKERLNWIATALHGGLLEGIRIEYRYYMPFRGFAVVTRDYGKNTDYLGKDLREAIDAAREGK